MVPFAPTMLICLACSTPNPDGAVYCARCGATLPRPAPVATLPGEPVKAAAPSAAPTPSVPPPPSAQVPTTLPATAPPPPAAGPLPSTVPLSRPDFPAGPPGPAAARPLTSGDVVDHKYRVESVLGEGGMGIVYLARDLNTDARVVVKAIRTEMAHDPDLRERVRAEGKALAHIDHPNVVRLNAVVVEHDELYLIMQYVDGHSLDHIITEHVTRRTPLAMPRVLSIFRQVVAGVGAAHEMGVVHRDIKPGNVLIRGRDGVAKVTDFGIAKNEDDAKAGKGKTRGIIGSLWYMAPEQVLGRRDLDKRADIYALGILLYELITGRVPFDAPGDYDIMRMHIEAPLPSVFALRPDAPPWLDSFLARCCAKERDHRFSSCDEMLAVLDEVAPEAARGTMAQAARVPTALPMPAATQPGMYSPPHHLTPVPSHVGAISSPGHPTPATPLPPYVQPHERAATTTDDPMPIAPPSHHAAPARWPWVVGAVVILGGIGAAVAFGTDLLKSPDPKPRPAAGTASSTARPPVSAAPSASAAPATPLERLKALEGAWASETGRHYRAVLLGDILEFRIENPGEFTGQDYHKDEARFTLAVESGQSWFAVEDRIRPRGPTSTTFSAASRSTCLGTWKTVKGEPLKAYVVDATHLRVDLVNVTPDLKNFVQQPRGTIVSCNNLGSSPADRTETILVRP